jgi:predicted nuclease of predicted toxin-antitoxin system
MRVLIDMNLSPRWVLTLAAASIDAVHWSTLGAKDALDREIIARARPHDYVVLTHDLDFGAILPATGREKPSVVRTRALDGTSKVIGGRVVLALREMENELQDGALITVEPDRTPYVSCRCGSSSSHRTGGDRIQGQHRHEG